MDYFSMGGHSVILAALYFLWKKLHRIELRLNGHHILVEKEVEDKE